MLGYVVYSPGRTGSSAISRMLKAYHRSCVVYQTHNPLFLPDQSIDYVAIISKRLDLFQVLISKLTLQLTGEFYGYDRDRTFTSFAIRQDEFEGIYHFVKSFYSLIDCNKFSDSKEIVFEDFINNPEASLGITTTQLLRLPEDKSTYKYSELVVNLDQCRDWFKKLEQTELNPKILDYVRRDIENTPDIDKWTGITV